MRPFVRRRLAACMGAIFVLAALGGCNDPEQARREAERAGIVSELHQVDTEHVLAGQRLVSLQRRHQTLSEEIDALQSEADDLERRTTDYMMSHKLAVAALAAGFAGGVAALDDSGRVSEEARSIGAVVGIVALLYAASNADEVMTVADQLLQADTAMKATARRLAELTASREAVAREAADTRAALDRHAQSINGLRGRLAAL